MKVLVAMSGGVDSSVAAATLAEAGHDVVGVTLKLWGGDTDSGCCTVADAHDARRVADALDVDHYVWSYADEFERQVVAPYAAAHAEGLTPNPCVDCNRHVKWGALLDRAARVGFDAVATGHHARLAPGGRLLRGVDSDKDQSYVLASLDRGRLATTLLPVGHLTKDQVRAAAADRGLLTADKPDSQDLCFVAGDRRSFLSSRIPLRPARVVDSAGRQVGEVPAAELVTVGQRKGLGIATGDRRYALQVEPDAGRVTVGSAQELLVERQPLAGVSWHRRGPGAVLAQTSAHGPTRSGTVTASDLVWDELQPRVAPGQVVALYHPDHPDEVLGAARASR